MSTNLEISIFTISSSSSLGLPENYEYKQGKLVFVPLRVHYVTVVLKRDDGLEENTATFYTLQNFQANRCYDGIEKDDTYNVNQTLVSSNQCKTGISFQTANGKKISISEESQIPIQNNLSEFQDDLQETDYETELKDIKARI
uniref:Uncharacterized protein n=1 Tax=Glossina pallidipes TaxID=7398 RepID=A0A1B0ACC5_GLOPL